MEFNSVIITDISNEISIENLDIDLSNNQLNILNENIMTLSLDNLNKSKNVKHDCSDNQDNQDDREEEDCEIDVDLLKKMIIRWIKLDDIIKEYNKEVKECKNEKTQLEDKILEYMNHTDQNEITVKDGKLEKKKSETKESINEEYIKKCLVNSIDDVVMIDKLTNIILNSRAITESYKLARKMIKTTNSKKSKKQ